MATTSITIVGLGPGQLSDLTLQAYTLFEQAAAQNSTVYFRTLIHPTIEPLKQALPGLSIESFDHFYEKSNAWETLYQQIAEEICRLGEERPIIYAVPGDPLIGETSVQRVLSMAKERGLSTRIVAGLSFLEPVCSILELDPFEQGTQIVDATMLAALDLSEVAGKIIPTVPLLIGQVYNRRLTSAVKLALGECYPDEWHVKLVRAAGVDTDEMVLDVPLYELDRNNFANHLCTLYIPPVDEMTALQLPETLRYITMRLRRDPDGCPWDRKQTHQSLRRYLLEESYEVLEALDENDMDKVAEELGDLLLQVYLHAEVARQADEFSIGDVFEHINAKLIRRHPHVFGTVEVENADQVVQNWEAIKKQERTAKGNGEDERKSILDGVPLASPALVVAQEYKKRVAKVGFEFETLQDVLAKIQEELQELQEASSSEHQLEEMGDLLFMVAQLATWFHIDTEEALRLANRKFRKRFEKMEEMIHEKGREFSSYSRKEWMELWRRAKV